MFFLSQTRNRKRSLNELYPVTERKGKYKHDIWFALGVDPKMTPWGALDEEIAGKRSHLPRYLLVANTLDLQLKLVKLCTVLFAIKLVGHFWSLFLKYME